MMLNLPDAARQVAHPLDLRRQPAHDDLVARRRAVLDEPRGRRRSVNDNDWVEVHNDHGVVVTRAVVSARIPRGICIIYHSPERTYSVPKSPLRNNRRAGGHNSLTAHAAEAEPDGRRLRPVHLPLQLLGTDRLQPRHPHPRSQAPEAHLVARKEPNPMDVRSQVSMVFHLDKCIGCHTCSVSPARTSGPTARARSTCGGTTSRPSPAPAIRPSGRTRSKYKGGWEDRRQWNLELRSTGKAKLVPNIFHNPHMPSMDDYYEPWTYKYEDLFNAPEGDDQPTAVPISMVTGEQIDIEAGPNWDDDLGGSEIYAENDVNLEGLTDEEREQMIRHRAAGLLLPAADLQPLPQPLLRRGLPVGRAVQARRGRDRPDQPEDRCRAWRACVPACPYKKTYFNWSTGKSEKCILCFPRLETGQAPACFHSCVGRIRYLGNVLYDADKIREMATLPDDKLVEAQRELILDPHDPEVDQGRQAPTASTDPVIESARKKSPVYRFVKEWKIALPPHIEYRTFPMLFYVPPLLPVMSRTEGDVVGATSTSSSPTSTRRARRWSTSATCSPAGTSASSATPSASSWRSRLAPTRHGRRHRRSAGRWPHARARPTARPSEADAIYKLSALATFDDRFVIPPFQREMAIEMLEDPHDRNAPTPASGAASLPKRS